MTSDQFLGLVRSLIAAVGGWAVGKGLISSDMLVTISGIAIAIATAAWSWWSNRPSKIVNTLTAQPKDTPGALQAKAVATGKGV